MQSLARAEMPDLDDITFGATLRAFEAPSLAITNCVEDALGATNCSRMISVINNRNLQSNAFVEGTIQIGLLF